MAQSAVEEMIEADSRITAAPGSRLTEEFDSEDELVEFLVDGNKPSDLDGVGNKTSERVFNWFKNNHPEANRERMKRDEAYCTEYVDRGVEDGEYKWAFVCPRCDHENNLKGEPKGFRNKPFRCVNCNWVPLLAAEAIDRFVEERGEV